MYFQIEANEARQIGSALSAYVDFKDDFEMMVRSRFTCGSVRDGEGFRGGLVASERSLIIDACKKQMAGVPKNSRIFTNYRSICETLERGAGK